MYVHIYVYVPLRTSQGRLVVRVRRTLRVEPQSSGDRNSDFGITVTLRKL